MKHDLYGFSREIVRLIKTTGDTGGSGDKSKQSLRRNGLFVPTRCKAVSPAESEWGHHRSASGDSKSKYSQAVAESVPSVPTATRDFQVIQQTEMRRDVPEEWHAIVAGLKQCDPAGWLSHERWRELISDAEKFLADWGSTAHLLGWTSLDLFGVHPSAPAARFDVMGLIPILDGADVLALTNQTVTMRRLSGAVLTFRRPQCGEAVLLSHRDRPGPAALGCDDEPAQT